MLMPKAQDEKLKCEKAHFLFTIFYLLSSFKNDFIPQFYLWIYVEECLIFCKFDTERVCVTENPMQLGIVLDMFFKSENPDWQFLLLLNSVKIPIGKYFCKYF